MAASREQATNGGSLTDETPGTALHHGGTYRQAMAINPSDLTDDAITFLTQRHLATLTTVDSEGRPHAVPVGFTWDPASGLARIITRRGSKKARRLTAAPGSPVTVCQIDGGRWLAMEGTAVVTEDPDRVAEAVARYTARYRQPEENSERVAIEITIERVIGRW